MPEFLRKANQLTEIMMLAGPGNEELGELRKCYGYRPEATTREPVPVTAWTQPTMTSGVTVFAFDVAGDRIRLVWAVRNPEKLRRWATG